MALLLSVTEGWTKELGPFILAVDGVPLPLGGFTVELVLKTSRLNVATQVDTTGDTRVDADQVGNPGEVYYKPDAADFLRSGSPYTVHWKVTDGAGDIVFFPNGAPDQIVVHAP